MSQINLHPRAVPVQPRPEAISPSHGLEPDAAYMAPGDVALHPCLTSKNLPPRQAAPAAALESIQQQHHRRRSATSRRRAARRPPATRTRRPMTEATSPTLSPSAFMLHQYTLPGCDNFYGNVPLRRRVRVRRVR